MLLLPETIILVRSDGSIKNSVPVIGNNIQKPDVMKIDGDHEARPQEQRIIGGESWCDGAPEHRLIFNV